jgi:HAD superfamily hydrolase (TIGR01484 family)
LIPLHEAKIDRAQIRGVLTDIDDTLTTRGRLRVEALSALEQLSQMGKLVIPVTGSPASLALHAARLWPVSAAIGESGAVYYRRQDQRLNSVFWDEEEKRAELTHERDAMLAEVLAKFPGAKPASDQAFRLQDLAIDHSEDVAPLSADTIASIRALLHTRGYTTRQSSIHINAWKSNYDKLPMSLRCVRECFGLDLSDAAERARWLYVGDAPNDEAMFEFFPHSIGVANAREHHFTHPPRYITQAARGAGFAEVVQWLKNGSS